MSNIKYFCYFISFVHKWWITARVNSDVEEVPPISLVLIFPSVKTSFKALEIWSANLGSPKYLNIITELNNIEVGLAMFLPAMDIPECGIPCENKANYSPIQAPGVIPTPPVIPKIIKYKYLHQYVK